MSTAMTITATATATATAAAMIENLAIVVDDQQQEQRGSVTKAVPIRLLAHRRRNDDDNNDDECSVGTATTVATCCTSDDESVDNDNDDNDEYFPDGRRRTVRFAVSIHDERNTVYENPREGTSAYDPSACWYAREDYRRFKANTRGLAHEVAAMEQRNRAPYSYRRVLLRVHELCRSSATAADAATTTNTATTVTEDENTTPSVLLRQQQQQQDENDASGSEIGKQLKRWMDYAPTRCGLEKWAIQELAQDRSRRRCEIVQTVLALQQQPSYSSSYDKDYSDCDNGSDELIRFACERISQPSRSFARCMGWANHHPSSS